jgi:hypothetical protein
VTSPQRSLVQQAVGWLAGYFGWLRETLSSDTARRAVLADLGLDADDPPPLAVDGERITAIDRYRDQVDPSHEAFLGVWQDVLAVVEAVDGFVAAAGAGGQAAVKEAVRQFLSVTGTEYMRLRYPLPYFAARLLAVIEDVVPAQFHRPVDVVVTRDVFTNLVALLEAPVDHLDRVFSTPGTEDDARRLAAHTLIPLGLVLAYWEQTAHHAVRLVGAEFELPKRKVLHGWDDAPGSTTPVADRLSQHALSFAFEGLRVGGPPGDAPASATVGVTLMWVPAEHGGPGLFVSLHGAADLNVPVSTVWRLNTKRGTSDVIDALVWDSVRFRPAADQPGPGESTAGEPATTAAARTAAESTPAGGGSVGDEEVRFTLEPVRATPEEPYVLSVVGTRVEIGELSVSLRLGRQQVEVKVLARRSAVVLGGGDGDGFVAQLLPQGGARLEFDLGLGLVLSPELRFYLEGGSGLATTIPLDRSLGPARLQQLHLELASGRRAAHGGLRFEASVAASLRLGAITATVDRLGFELVIDTDGGRPPAVGYKAPSGVGLVIDATVVTGAGYLFHDAARGQYAGVVQLELKGLTLQAIGLITTRLPSGQRGFSLLVIIAASDFAPINLGFGFRLTGIGGLLGFNRTVELEPMRAGLKSGALDNVLFPENPVRDAPRIVTALDTFMPARQDQFLLGPTARITWGVPAVLTIKLGVVVEAPSPTRLVVLGQLRAVLPGEDGALIRLQMDALGVVDFERRDIAVDAVLHDSKVAKFTVTGDMALRARFGDDPAFALAVGGLHPRFTPPSGFPKLARVAVGLSQGDNTKLVLQAYLALTSNTAQIGARLDLLVRASGFSVEGTLGFDALFQFSPFSFVVDLRAGVTLKWHGHTLLGVELELTLSGPSPWNARGTATFKIWRFSKSVSFDRTIGPAAPPPPLPTADPLSELLVALADRRNWEAQLPRRSAMLVALREGPPGPAVALHPLGQLRVRQRVVPLGVEISRFGNATPAGERRFEVSVRGPGGRPMAAAMLRDHFAPAQFLNLSDAQRLERPSFELMDAGVRVGAGSVHFGGQDDPGLVGVAELAYETIVVGAAQPEGRAVEPFTATSHDLDVSVANGAVARSVLHHSGEARFASPTVGVRAVVPGFTVTRTSDLGDAHLPELSEPAPSYTVAWQAMQRHLATHPELRGRLQVTEVALIDGSAR